MTIAAQAFTHQVHSTPAAAGKAAISETELQTWLAERIAHYLNKSSEEIDLTLPFSFYGLDSVAALGLSGELEERLRVKLPPTLTWDFPTIESLSRHLAGA